MLAAPLLEVSTDTVAAEEPLRTAKSQLAGTPWEAAFDARVKNVPLDTKVNVGMAALNGSTKITRPKATVNVKLVDAGAEPRRELHYAPTAGAKRTAIYHYVTGLIPGTSELMPSLNFTIDTTTEKVDESSPWKYSYVVTRSEVSPTKNAIAQAVTKTMVTGTDGITGFVQQDEHGGTVNTDMKFKPGNEPRTGPPVSVVGSLSSTVVPLPVEATGKNATWKAEMVAEGPITSIRKPLPTSSRASTETTPS